MPRPHPCDVKKNVLWSSCIIDGLRACDDGIRGSLDESHTVQKSDYGIACMISLASPLTLVAPRLHHYRRLYATSRWGPSSTIPTRHLHDAQDQDDDREVYVPHRGDQYGLLADHIESYNDALHPHHHS